MTAFLSDLGMTHSTSNVAEEIRMRIWTYNDLSWPTDEEIRGLPFFPGTPGTISPTRRDGRLGPSGLHQNEEPKMGASTECSTKHSYTVIFLRKNRIGPSFPRNNASFIESSLPRFHKSSNETEEVLWDFTILFVNLKNSTVKMQVKRKSEFKCKSSIDHRLDWPQAFWKR